MLAQSKRNTTCSFILLEQINCQFDYGGQTSTLLPIIPITASLTNYKTEGTYVYACFVNFSKAFKKVTHDIIKKKVC